MQKKFTDISSDKVTRFDRHFFDSKETFTCIGSGSLGGKGRGLAFIREIIAAKFDRAAFPDITVTVPTLTVLTTELFDEFMKINNLYEAALSDLRDDQMALTFQKGDLPPQVVGDLMALIAHVNTPLAIRSSSLLEDAIYEPFAGVYATKMIPNNQHESEVRFRKLTEAIKFVYASTYFRAAKSYIKTTGRDLKEEKMAVIIQEVVGLRHGDRYYPHLSGVARSYNYYPTGHSRPEDGVINLALGLGKTIVDGGSSWTYAPPYPRANPPYNSLKDLCRQTQTMFWAVNMGKPPAHDPIHETEYLSHNPLDDAEADGTLRFAASTFVPGDDRLVTGINARGVRVATFAPLLIARQVPLNDLLKHLMAMSHDAVGAAIEMEFAATLDPANGLPLRFGYLQVRPMVVSQADVNVGADDLVGERVIVASEQVLGNGVSENLHDIVYVKPEKFDASKSPIIAEEIEKVNKKLLDEEVKYLLIGFGRWGSSEPWLGIPVEWGSISGVGAIVEAMLPEMHIDLSQGSHFFHNLTSFQVYYFSVPAAARLGIKWEKLNSLPATTETEYVRHVRLASPLKIRVDGKSGRGVIEL